VQRALSGVFLGNDADVLAADLRRLALVFDGDVGSENGLLRETDNALTNLSAAGAQDDVRLFEDSVSRLKQHGASLGLQVQDLEPSLLRERFVVRAAERGAFESVFAMLPHIRGDKRTPTVHAAVLRSLLGISADKVAQSITADTQAALELFAEKDEEIAAKNQMLVRRGVQYCLAHGQPEEAFRLLRGVRGASGALHESLVPLVSDLVKAFLDRSQRDSAQAVAAVFGQRLGLRAQLNLYLSHFGVSFLQAVSALGAFLGCGLAWFVRKRKRLALESRIEPENRGKPDSAADASLVNKAEAPSAELVKALASFGLGPGATLTEIKNTYRMRVKECHPDRNRESSAPDNDEFVRLTTEYDLLLALYQRERTADK
jgi:hypothetical protein